MSVGYKFTVRIRLIAKYLSIEELTKELLDRIRIKCDSGDSIPYLISPALLSQNIQKKSIKKVTTLTLNSFRLLF